MDELELVVDEGRSASASRFFALGADLLSLLDELCDLPVPWRIVNLRTGSALATVAPPEDSPTEARHFRNIVRSLDAVQSGAGLPDDWTPDAVSAAHRLAQHGQAGEGEEGWVPARLRLVTDGANDGPGVALTPRLVERLVTLQPFEREMAGSVRGELVGVNVSRGNRASLRLRDRRVVRVGFASALREAMRDALLQDVELDGLVRQDGDGRVFKVRAESIRVLQHPGGVRWSELFGIDPGYTDGLPAEQWLEGNRGEA